MRVLTSKDGKLSTYFGKIIENINTTLKKILIDNHTTQAKKGKIFGIIRLEHIFGFCKTFKTIAKGLGFI